jgi:hypothetical protein
MLSCAHGKLLVRRQGCAERVDGDQGRRFG